MIRIVCGVGSPAAKSGCSLRYPLASLSRDAAIDVVSAPRSITCQGSHSGDRSLNETSGITTAYPYTILAGNPRGAR